MRSTTLFLLFISFCSISFSQLSFDNDNTFYTDSSQTVLCNGKFRKFYSGYKIRSSSTYLNGKLSGETVEYFIDGQVKMKINYLNGQFEGESLEYYPETSILKSKFFFSNGLKNGECFTYDEKGEVFQKWNFLNGVIQ